MHNGLVKSFLLPIQSFLPCLNVFEKLLSIEIIYNMRSNIFHKYKDKNPYLPQNTLKREGQKEQEIDKICPPKTYSWKHTLNYSNHKVCLY